jgi:hypothetical protein
VAWEYVVRGKPETVKYSSSGIAYWFLIEHGTSGFSGA